MSIDGESFYSYKSDNYLGDKTDSSGKLTNTDRVALGRRISQLLLKKESKNSIETTEKKVASVFDNPLPNHALERSEQVISPKPTITSQAKTDRFIALLHLNVMPDAPDGSISIHGRPFSPVDLKVAYVRISSDQKDLIAQHIDSGKAAAISTQAGKFPLMQAAVEALRSNLEKWDDLDLSEDKDSFEKLKATVQQQFRAAMNLQEDSMKHEISEWKSRKKLQKTIKIGIARTAKGKLKAKI